MWSWSSSSSSLSNLGLLIGFGESAVSSTTPTPVCCGGAGGGGEAPAADIKLTPTTEDDISVAAQAQRQHHRHSNAAKLKKDVKRVVGRRLEGTNIEKLRARAKALMPVLTWKRQRYERIFHYFAIQSRIEITYNTTISRKTGFYSTAIFGGMNA